MNDPLWQPGPPPGRGKYWICWSNGAVEPVRVATALAERRNPDAELLLIGLGYGANKLDDARSEISHHAPFVAPEEPDQ